MLPSELWDRMESAHYYPDDEIVPLCDTLAAEVNRRLGSVTWERCPICTSMAWHYHIILAAYPELQFAIFDRTAAILAELDKEVQNAAQ